MTTRCAATSRTRSHTPTRSGLGPYGELRFGINGPLYLRLLHGDGGRRFGDALVGMPCQTASP